MKERASVKSKGAKGHHLRTLFLKLQRNRLNEAKRAIKELEQTIVRIEQQTARAEAEWKESDAIDKMIRKTRRK